MGDEHEYTGELPPDEMAEYKRYARMGGQLLARLYRDEGTPDNAMEARLIAKLAEVIPSWNASPEIAEVMVAEYREGFADVTRAERVN